MQESIDAHERGAHNSTWLTASTASACRVLRLDQAQRCRRTTTRLDARTTMDHTALHDRSSRRSTLEAPTSLILAAAFDHSLGAARAAGAVIALHHPAIDAVALGDVVTDGTPQLGASVQWSSGRGMLVRGVLGPTGGPLRIVECGAAASASSRDFGAPSPQLARFGAALCRGDSVVVFEIQLGAVQSARSLIEALGPRDAIVAPFDDALGAVRDCLDDCIATPFAA